MVDALNVFNISPFKEIRFNKPANVIPCARGGFLVTYRNSPLVSRYNASYNLHWELDLGDSQHSFNVTISPDGSMIAVSGVDYVRIYDGEGQLLFTRTHLRWEPYQETECYFHSGGNGNPTHILFFEPADNGEGFLQLFDATNFQLIKSLPWECMDSFFYFFPTSDPFRILINLLSGQDGSQLYLAMLVDNNLLVAEQEQCAELTLIHFSPAGHEFAAIEYNEQNLVVYSFPDMEQVAMLEGEQIFTDADRFPSLDEDTCEYDAYYLSDKTMLIRTRFGRLLLINREPLQRMGELVLEGCALIPYDERGKPATNAKDITDYASEAQHVFITPYGDLVVIHETDGIKIYKLPDFT